MHLPQLPVELRKRNQDLANVQCECKESELSVKARLFPKATAHVDVYQKLVLRCIR